MTTATRNGVFPTDPREAAAYYLDLGMAPIPLPPRNKDPRYADWQHLRLTADSLDNYFPAGVACNIGILNGAPSSNHLDVDLDCQETITAAPFLLPPTGWIFGRPGKPKSHWIYHADKPFATAQLAFKDFDGAMLLELRGTGGLTVYPPSTHDATGERITWAQFTEPAEIPLWDLQTTVHQIAAAALLARHWPVKGGRQDAALALAGGLLRGAWDLYWVERFIEAVAAAAGDEQIRMRVQTVARTADKQRARDKTTGWTKLVELLGNDGTKVVQQVRKWLGMDDGDHTSGKKTRKAVPLEPYQPFPTNALPEPVASYVSQGATALGCDPAYLALPSLSVLASLIGNRRSIRLKRDWTEPSIIWTGIIGDSGTLKSPALKMVDGPIFRLQKRLLDEFRRQLTDYQDALADYKERKKKAKEDGTDPGDPPEEPVLRRVVCSDTTIEKLADILQDNPSGTLIVRDELAGWLQSFTRYKGKGGGSDLPNWLEMFRAGTVVVDRKAGDRPTLFIPRAAVSIAGGFQPSVLARLMTSEFLDAGLGARLLMAMPEPVRKRWSEAEIHPEVKDAYERLIATLMDLDYDRDKDGEKIPYVVKLTPEAKEIWVRFYEEWADRQTAAEGELAASYSKLEAYAARFSLIHHVIIHAPLGDDCDPIAPASIEAGITLARWFGTEARRIYAMLGESVESRQSRRLTEFVRARGGSITGRQLQRSNPAKFPTVDQAETALQELVDTGVAEWQRHQPQGGGRPSQICVLLPHPTIDKTRQNSPGEDDADDSDGWGSPDKTPTPPPTTPGFSGENGVLSGFVNRRVDTQGVGNDDQPGASAASGTEEFCQANGVLSGAHYQHGPGQNGCAIIDPTIDNTRQNPSVGGTAPEGVTMIDDPANLQSVIWALEESDRIGLDLETTGLDPKLDRIRLLSLATDRGTYLVDCFTVDPAPLWEYLADKTLIGHNLAFDLSFLARLGFVPGAVRDTMLMSQLVYAGQQVHHKLPDCTQRELDRTIDKELQKSDWSRSLTTEQLHYAALDVEVLRPLYEALDAKIHKDRLGQVAAIEHRCLPAMVWLAGSGITFSSETWQTLATGAEEDAARLGKELEAQAPAREQREMYGSGWNWDSPAQVKQVFQALGIELESTGDEALAKLNHPLAGLLRQYRDARKRCTTYGKDWLKHVAADGRVYANWRQIGAASGRMSCSAPNLQQLPRGQYRRCFQAPSGRVLVKVDYSQIELRIAAKVSGDEAMLLAYRAGLDLHTLTAQRLLGKEDVSKEDRQIAKSANFGLLYGMGAKGYQAYAQTNYGVEMTEAEAKSYRAAFFNAYPGLNAWHTRTRNSRNSATRTLIGRRRWLDERAFDTLRLNTPVQGTGADGLKLALALLWERRVRVPGAFPVLVVHDEIVMECDQDQAEAVSAWLKEAMIEAMAGWLDPVPVDVEVKVARTWGGD